MDLVNETFNGAAELFDGLFSGGAMSKGGKIVIGIVILLIVLALIFLAYYLYNKSGMSSNRLMAGSGCCRDNQLGRATQLEYQASSFDEYAENTDRGYGPDIGPRYNSNGYNWANAYPFSSGTGYDNVQGFTGSKPDASPYSATGLTYPSNNEPLVRQKFPSPQFVKPYMDEQAFVNYAGRP